MSSETLLMDYLRESASWDADRVVRAQLHARRAWMVAALATLLAAISVSAVAMLAPLKRVEPFLIRVDGSTGAVDVVPTYSGHGTLPEVVTRYLLAHYVRTCERYYAALAEQDYTECGAFHGARRNQEWFSLWTPSNPQSPLNRYRDGTSVAVQIQSISFLPHAEGNPDLAQVRFTRTSHSGSGGSGTAAHWIANVQYGYETPAANSDIRRWNPLGFRILEYHTEAEASAPANDVATQGETK